MSAADVELIKAVRAADAATLARVRTLLAAEPAAATVDNPDCALAAVRPLLLGREREALVVVALNRRRRVIDVAVLSEGSPEFTVVDPKTIYRWALTRAKPTSAIILAHNHPSGDPAPSPQDRDVTDRVGRAGFLLGIPLLDHLVVTDAGGYRSLAADGHIPTSAAGGNYFACGGSR